MFHQETGITVTISALWICPLLIFFSCHSPTSCYVPVIPDFSLLLKYIVVFSLFLFPEVYTLSSSWSIPHHQSHLILSHGGFFFIEVFKIIIIQLYNYWFLPVLFCLTENSLLTITVSLLLNEWMLEWNHHGCFGWINTTF